MLNRLLPSRKSIIAFPLILGAIAFFPYNVLAQIIPDTTLGTEGSVVNPIGENFTRIDGGVLRGVNLFHSFQEFNINQGASTYFSNPAGIINIFSRVTGKNPSQILGTLGVLGNANLFFLNPNGIIFGANSRLDISGSFIGSTGSGFILPDGTEYSATNPQVPPLLTVTATAPVGLKLEGQPGMITSQGSLVVGQDLTLFGGNLDIQGQLLAGGNLTLQGINIITNGQLVSGGNFQVEQLDGHLGNIFSPAGTIIQSGGDVALNSYTGASLKILAGGEINLTGSVEASGSAFGGNGGDVTLLANDNITSESINTSTNLTNFCFNTCSNGGNIQILSREGAIDTRGGTLNTSTIYNNAGFPLGKAGNVTLEASGDIKTGEIDASSNFANAGNITITSHNGLVDTSSGTLRTSIKSALIPINIPFVGSFEVSTLGSGGNVSISAAGDIITGEINASGGVGKIPEALVSQLPESLVEQFDIDINSALNTIEPARGGNITLTSGNQLSISNHRLISNTYGLGQSGDINIQAREVSLTDNGQIITGVIDVLGKFGEKSGRGGNLVINASELLTIEGKSILGTFTTGTGNAGKIDINTRELRLSDGIIASITLDDNDLTNENNPQIITIKNIFSDLSVVDELTDNNIAIDLITASITGQEVNIGNAGNINIDTDRSIVREGASISSITFSGGNGGNIAINATEEVRLIGTSADEKSPSSIRAETYGSNNAGNVNINSPRLILTDGAFVSTATGDFTPENKDIINTGDAGNLTVNAYTIVLSGTSPKLEFRSSLLTATASVGDAGQLIINTDNLIIENGASVLAATLDDGNSGVIEINADSIIVKGTAGDGFGSILATGTAGKGRSNELRITTRTLTIQDGAIVTAGTYAEGSAGDLMIDATDSVIVEGQSLQGRPSILTTGSGIKSDIPLLLRYANPALATGNSGNLNINTRQLIVRNGGEISSATLNQGRGGNIEAQATSIALNNDGQISTDNSGTGEGGTITLRANNITLDRGIISSQTTSGTGGNITLTVGDRLELGNRSQISTTAGIGGQGGDGGNITIRSNFIFARPDENSNITANAFTGRGGKIQISTQGIFGIEPRPTPSLLSDITASSELGVDGTIEINRLNTDPIGGLIDLPEAPIEVRVAQGCQVEGEESLAFFKVGRGGLLPKPEDFLSSETIIAPWIPLVTEGNNAYFSPETMKLSLQTLPITQMCQR